MEEVRSVPVPKRKLSSKSSNASQDDVVSKEVESLLRLLVFKTAVDLSRFLMQPARSLAEDKTAAAHPDNNESGGRELRARVGTYGEYDCDGCLAFFERAQQYSTEDQRVFCLSVTEDLAEKYPDKVVYLISFTFYCETILECPSTYTPRMCCAANWKACS